MESYEIKRLNLLSSIYYTPLADPNPFGYTAGARDKSGGEELFCFELDEAQYLSIEPDKKSFLGSLIFGGGAGGAADIAREAAKGAEKKLCELPRGNYLFAQKRETLSRDDIIAMAVEIQQEGLWQRLKPGKTLYLRYLVEDSSAVTQVLRPYTDGKREES